MKTLSQIRAELEADPAYELLTKLVNGQLAPCTADERAFILDERAQVIFNAPSTAAVVSFRALAFALLKAGLYEQAKAAALATAEGEIWWNTAQSTTVRSDHPFVADLAQAVGQTPEQINAIFAAAKLHNHT